MYYCIFNLIAITQPVKISSERKIGKNLKEVLVISKAIFHANCVEFVKVSKWMINS